MFLKKHCFLLTIFSIFFSLLFGALILLLFHGLPLHYFLTTYSFNDITLTSPYILLKYDGRIKLLTKDLQISYGGQDYLIKQLSFYLNNKKLLHASLALEQIEINAPTIAVSVTSNNLTISSNNTNISHKTANSIVKSILEFKNTYFPQELELLESIKIKNGKLKFSNLVDKKIYDIKIKNLTYENDSITHNALISSDLKIVIPESSIPIKLRLKTFSNGIKINLNASDISSKILADFSPIFNKISGTFNINSKAKLNLNDDIKSLNLTIDWLNSTINLPNDYSQPIKFKAIHIEGNKLKNDLQLKANISDLNQTKLTFSSTLKNFLTTPFLKAQLTLDKAQLHQLEYLIPDKSKKSLHTWITKRLSNAKISKIKVNMSGKLDSIFQDVKNNFSADFDYDNLFVKYLPKAPLAQKLAGHFSFRQGEIVINSKNGNIGNQKLEDFSTTFKNIFGTGVSILEINSNIKGDIKELNTIISKLSNANPLDFQGKHSSKVKITIPLLDDIHLKDVIFDIKGQATNASFILKNEQGKTYLIKSSNLKVTLINHILKAHGKATLDNSYFQLDFSAPIFNITKGLKINLSGNFDFAEYIPRLSDKYVQVSNFNYVGSIQISHPRTWKISFNLASKQNYFSLPFLVFSADKNSILQIKGNSLLNEKAIILENLSVKAGKFYLETSSSFNLEDLASSKLFIKKLYTDKTTLHSLSYDKNNIQVIAEKLFLPATNQNQSQVDVQKNTDNDSFTPTKLNNIIPKNLNFVSHFSELQYGINKLFNLYIELVRRNKNWEKIVIKAIPNKSHYLKVNLENQKLIITSNNFNSILSFFSNLPLSNQASQATITLSSANNFDLTNFNGTVKTENLIITNMPLIIKILSVFSAKKLFSLQAGVVFNTVNASFAINKDILTIQEASFNSELFSLIFNNVTIDLNSKSIVGRGRLTLLASVAELTEIIPLIGNFISKTQRYMVAIPFSVSGTTTAPNVSLIF